MRFEIRPYHQSDLVSLYRICLLTADSGGDASHLYNDPEIVGQFYAAPYAVFEPELCFVVTNAGKPCGYILGTKDSLNFSEQCENEWFPSLRNRYPLPEIDDQSYDARIIRLIHGGNPVKKELIDYPAHLHIDILPEAQGQGMGRRLMDVFCNKLKELKVKSVHLEVGKSNTGAIKYYEKIGYHRIIEYEYSIAFGKHFGVVR